MHLIQDLSWPMVLLIGFAAGAVLSHALYVLIHDLTHYTAFRSRTLNQLTAILANCGNGVPSAITFGRYHADHHIFLGRPNWDPDMPGPEVVRFFTTPIRKFLYCLFMPLIFGMRPFFVCPKPLNLMEIINFFTVIGWDIFVGYHFGAKAVVYLLLGTLFGLGLHPVGVHLIAEHAEFIQGQDTYSYYGHINKIILNIGYHIEHHDFPNIPWRKLPRLREIAPEFYETLPQHTSYALVLWKFIFGENFGPWSRIGRTSGEDIIKHKRD